LIRPGAKMGLWVETRFGAGALILRLLDERATEIHTKSQKTLCAHLDSSGLLDNLLRHYDNMVVRNHWLDHLCPQVFQASAVSTRDVKSGGLRGWPWSGRLLCLVVRKGGNVRWRTCGGSRHLQSCARDLWVPSRALRQPARRGLSGGVLLRARLPPAGTGRRGPRGAGSPSAGTGSWGSR
jgi:CubicO group peptidase (beta-lactamase class C family)